MFAATKGKTRQRERETITDMREGEREEKEGR